MYVFLGFKTILAAILWSSRCLPSEVVPETWPTDRAQDAPKAGVGSAGCRDGASWVADKYSLRYHNMDIQ